MLFHSPFYKFCYNFLQSNDEQIHYSYNLFYNIVGTTFLVLLLLHLQEEFCMGLNMHVYSLLSGEWKYDLYAPYLAIFPFHYCKVSLMAYNLVSAVPMALQYFST